MSGPPLVYVSSGVQSPIQGSPGPTFGHQAFVQRHETQAGTQIHGSDDGHFSDSHDSSSPSNPTLSETDGEAGLKGGRKKRKKRRKICIGAIICGVAFVSLILILFWPRDPTWEVKRLVFKPSDIQRVVTVFTDPKFNGTFAFDNTAEVQFYNPNFIGASVGEGPMTADYKGHRLANVSVASLVVPARDYAMAYARSHVVITPQLSKFLTPEVAADGYVINVRVQGSLLAKVHAIFKFGVQVDIACTVRVTLLKLMENPDEMVIGHDCAYHGSLG